MQKNAKFPSQKPQRDATVNDHDDDDVDGRIALRQPSVIDDDDNDIPASVKAGMWGIRLRRHIRDTDGLLFLSSHSTVHHTSKLSSQTMLTLGASVAESPEHARTRVI